MATRSAYLAEFVMMDCAPDILAAKIFPNPKEITESMGAFNAVRKYVCDDWSNPKIALVSVGDGNTPRTAGLFAFRSAWKCFSIDPRLKDKKWPIKRLSCLTRSVEDSTLVLTGYEQVIIVMIHSHAPIQATREHVIAAAGQRHIVSIPCCVPHEIPKRPYLGYSDADIASPMRMVKIWMNI